jgi:hypothetical protein
VDYTPCSDPEIRRAAFELTELPPERHKQINLRLNQGQAFVLHTSHGVVDGIAKIDMIMPMPTKSAAGNLVQPKKIAEQTIRNILIKQGKSPEEISAALAKYHSLPEGQICEISDTLEVKNWTVDNIGFKGGERIHPILLVKIAYEFLALHLGVAIYSEEPQLNEIRRVLLTLDRKNAFVVAMKGDKPHPIHGLAFEGNNPYAQVQIRLFGTLAYRVNFPWIAINASRTVYTLNLAENEHYGSLLN